LTLTTLLGGLAAAGVQIRVDGQDLVVNGPDGELTPDLLDQLRAHKAELLVLLSRPGEVLSEALGQLARLELLAGDRRGYPGLCQVAREVIRDYHASGSLLLFTVATWARERLAGEALFPSVADTEAWLAGLDDES
jgi:hypothetical protein